MRIFLAAALALWAVAAQAQPIGPSNSTSGAVTPSGTFTSGDLVCGAGGTSIQDCSALSTAATVPRGLQFTNNIVYSGASNATNRWFSQDGKTITGTATAGLSGAIAPFELYVGGDGVDASTGFLTLMHVEDAPGAGFKGGRVGVWGQVAVVGTPGAALGGAGLVGVFGQGVVSANLLGTTGVYTNYAGTIFGGNSQVIGKNGATFIQSLVASEFDASCETGCSTAELHAATFVLTSDSTSRGVYDDSAIAIGTQGGSTTWKYGIAFGGYASPWPHGVDSTLIYAWTRQAGGSSSPVALNGIDFSNITFQTAGCVLKSTNFCIDGPTGDLLLAAAGTTTNPSIALTTCGTNCGILAPASNQIEVVVGGANKLDYGISTSGQWTFSTTVQFGGSNISGPGAIIFNGGYRLFTPTTTSLQLAATDSATPPASSVKFPSVVAGTTNTAGVSGTIIGSLSTGSGVSGDIIVQTGGTGAGATVQNSPVTALTIKGATQQVIFSGQINVAAMTQTAAAQSGTVCYNSGTGVITYDATLGCLASTLNVKDRWQDIDPDQALALVIRMRPGSFSYKPDLGLPTGEQIGFAAEQIAEVDDRLVGRRPDGSLAGVRYQQSSALYAAAIQALKSQLETLERRVH